MEDRIEVPRDWIPDWASNSSPVWFLGVHMYDLIRWILGSNAVSVYAKGHKEKLVSLGLDTFDSVQAQVSFGNGATVTFDTSWVLPDGFEAIVNQGIRVVGTEGVAEIDSEDRGARLCLSSRGRTETLNPAGLRSERDSRGRSKWSGYVIDSILHFARIVNRIVGGADVDSFAGTYPDGHDGLEATKTAEAVERSVSSGEVVDIEPD
jgi:predicted dehydrogenase